jgi:hypothetical protein
MRPILVAAAIIGAAPLLTSMDVMARSACIPRAPESQKLIPRPERILLTPSPKFDCELKVTGIDGGTGPSQASPARAEADTDAALRAKLDYELQCHRHAVMILRDRLLRLQALVDATVKAVDRRAQSPVMCRADASGTAQGAGTLIPLPDRALLTQPSEFNCEFKPTPLEGAGADAAMPMKLDYEQQCWRHAEIIVRDSLRRLQTAVDGTIKALSRSEQRAAKQQPEQSQQQLQRVPQQGHRSDLVRALQSGGFVIVHRYTRTVPGSSPPATAETIDARQRISPQGRADAQAMGEVYRRLKIPVSQVLSSESFIVYQTATAAFGENVKLTRDLTGSRAFHDPAELERSLSALRSRVATRPPTGTNVVLWTHEGKFRKAFGRPLAAGETVVFNPGSDGVPREVARLSLREFRALAE